MKKLMMLCAVCALAVLPIAAPAPARAADTTFTNPDLPTLGERGFKIVTGTGTVTEKFVAVIPLESTVINTITFPTKLAAGGAYRGDTAIQGKTLAANVRYPVFGNSIKLTSGSVMLVLR